MHVAAVVQARMSSQRLPGKVLAPLAGRPALAWLLERLAGFEVVVATSGEPSDDPVAAFCAERGVECFRGPLADVAARFAGAVERYGLDAFVRVNGDSPLLDPALVARGIELFRATEPDLATNVFPRSFPPGQSVEVVRAETFLAARPEFDERDREHVTTFFYARPERFRIENFAAAAPYEGPSHALDTAEDLARLEAWARALPRADAGWAELGAS
ncbi:MAG TPA: NTP transferase domain-containing protein [Gaiellaceae bacterium]|nr:NTP transferase domain-containing protein [Gaiellaceae bacterium]